MTEMAPEEAIDIKASGSIDLEGGLTVSAELPGASLILRVAKEQYENSDDWTFLIHSFPQAADQVLRALHEQARGAPVEDVDAQE